MAALQSGTGSGRTNLGNGVSVERRAGELGNLGMVSTQWATRPADQRFESVEAWLANAQARRAASTQALIRVGDVKLGTAASSIEAETGRVLHPGEVYIQGHHDIAHFSNYAFGQACSLAGAPASYLRSLPAELAVAPLQYGIATRGGYCYDGSGEAKLYAARLDRDGGSYLPAAADPSGSWLELLALTGGGYGRIYNAEVIAAVAELVTRSGGAWGIPDERVAFPGQTLGTPLERTTLYESKHDCFGFLVDAEHPIEVPATPGGSVRTVAGQSADVLYRGFVVWNSEVGDKTFGISTFYFRNVCQNRMIWGARDQTTLRIRHTSGGPGRFMRDALPALRAFANDGTSGVVATVQAARSAEVAKTPTDAISWLRERGFTANVAKFSVEAAEREEGRAASVWDLVNGVTAFARGIEFADDRVALERRAGALLEAVKVDAGRSAGVASYAA